MVKNWSTFTWTDKENCWCVRCFTENVESLSFYCTETWRVLFFPLVHLLIPVPPTFPPTVTPIYFPPVAPPTAPLLMEFVCDQTVEHRRVRSNGGAFSLQSEHSCLHHDCTHRQRNFQIHWRDIPGCHRDDGNVSGSDSASLLHLYSNVKLKWAKERADMISASYLHHICSDWPRSQQLKERDLQICTIINN